MTTQAIHEADTFPRRTVRDRIMKCLKMEASESHLTLALVISAITMALMLWAIIWQSDIIAYQRDIIRWIWTAKFGGGLS